MFLILLLRNIQTADCGTLGLDLIYRGDGDCKPCYYPCKSCNGVLFNQCSQCI